jgi:hypothetical protein
MPRTHAPYSSEFRRGMVELVRAGRTPEALPQKFETSAGAIRNWVSQALGRSTRDKTVLQHRRCERAAVRTPLPSGYPVPQPVASGCANRGAKPVRPATPGERLGDQPARISRRTDIGQPRESPHRHPHREVLPLDIARADVLRIRAAGDADFARAEAIARAIAALGLPAIATVELDEHGVVHVRAESLARSRRRARLDCATGPRDLRYGPVRRKNTLDLSAPCGWVKIANASCPLAARPT